LAMDDAAYPEPPRDYQEANLAMYSDKIVIMGGVAPGQTTDAVAAILAEYVHADLLIRTTSVDGVYSADPNVDKTAKKFDHMTPQQLLELVTRMEMVAGANNIFDMLGAQIVKRSHIPMVVVNGRDAHNIIEAINGKPIGTMIK
jgi:uridylate kinase